MIGRNLSFSREEIEEFRNFILQNKQNPDVTISNLLLALGFKPRLYGVTYLKEAIKYCYYCENDCKISFSGEVYPIVANKYNATRKQVERDIRTAIQTCYISNNMFKFNYIANYAGISNIYPPTNSEFIMKVAAWLKTELCDDLQTDDLRYGGGIKPQAVNGKPIQFDDKFNYG